MVGMVIATIRRFQVAPEERYQFSVVAGQTNLTPSTESTRGTVVNLVLVSTFLLAVISLGAGFGTQSEAEFTEMYLLSENESGAYTPTEYPNEINQSDGESFVLGVTNEEGKEMEYTVVVLLQNFKGEISNDGRIVASQLKSFSVELEDGETEEIKHSIEPNVAGENYRLVYLLYTSEPPSVPSEDTAYRQLHLFVDFVEGS